MEQDSEQAIRMIKDGSPPNCPFKVLAEACKALMARNGCTNDHTLPGGNTVADRLAKMGTGHNTHLVTLVPPMEEIKGMLAADLADIAFESGSATS